MLCASLCRSWPACAASRRHLRRRVTVEGRVGPADGAPVPRVGRASSVTAGASPRSRERRRRDQPTGASRTSTGRPPRAHQPRGQPMDRALADLRRPMNTSEWSTAGSGSATPTSARPPRGTGRASRSTRSPGGRCGWPSRRVAARGDRAGSRTLCPHGVSRGVCGAGLKGAESARWHRPPPRTRPSRGRWRPTALPPVGGLAGRPPHGASNPVCRDPSDSGRSPGPLFGRHAGRVEGRPGPLDGVAAAQLVEQDLVEPAPDAGLLPVAQPPPAGHATAAAHLLGQRLPRQAGAQDEEVLCEAATMRRVSGIEEAEGAARLARCVALP